MPAITHFGQKNYQLRVLTSEALAIGDLVNVYSNGGTANLRKADGALGYPAHGFVSVAYASGVVAIVETSGMNLSQSGMTPGTVYLSTSTPGRATSTLPTTALQQQVGVAVSASALVFEAATVGGGLSYVAVVVNAADALVFGGGADGNVTINSGTTTLTRDTYYNNLTMSGTGILNSGGCRIFVAGDLDISAAAAGAIRAPTTNGTNASGGGFVTGAAIPTAISVGAGTGGGNSAGGSVSAGGSGTTNPVPHTFVNGGDPGAAGAGGSGSAGANAGGSGGAATNGTSIFIINRITQDLGFYNTSTTGWQVINGGSGSPGGGGGGGNGAAGVGSGGGGATGGGVLYLFAKNIIRGASTPADCIIASGGNGGNGFTTTSNNSGGGGGGGGAGGGWIFLAYKTLSGASASNCVSANGGTGGSAGNGLGTGTGGTGGTGGKAGRIDVFNVTTGAVTIIARNVNSGTAGSANTGLTGGAGGAGGTARFTL